MFNEIAVDQRIDIADNALGVDLDARAQRGLLAAEDEGRAGHGESEIATCRFHDYRGF